MGLVETVYTSDSELRRPLRLLRSMFSDLVASRELAWRLFVRNVSARYRQTLLGYVWIVVPPLAATAAFAFLQAQGVLTAQPTDVPYPFYVLVGTGLWQVFADAINRISRVTLDAAGRSHDGQ